MVWIEGDLKDHLVPTPLPWAGNLPLDQVTENPSSLSGQQAPAFIPTPSSAGSGYHHIKEWAPRGSLDKVGSPRHPDVQTLAGLCPVKLQGIPKEGPPRPQLWHTKVSHGAMGTWCIPKPDTIESPEDIYAQPLGQYRDLCQYQSIGYICYL